MQSDELADLVGISRQALAAIEQERSLARESTLEKIRFALEQRGIRFNNGDTPTVSQDKSKAVIPT